MLNDDGESSLGSKVGIFKPSTWTLETVCLPASIVFGVIVGVSVPGNGDLSASYRPLSSVVGWIYFFSWTFSFYPQIYQNFVRKSSLGLAADKILFDVLGFSCLSVYSIALFGVPYVRQLYEDRNSGNSPKVQINDVCFAVHALLMTFVQIGQMAYFDGYKQFPSRTCVTTVCTVALIIFIYLIVVLSMDSDSGVFNLLDWFYFISFVKIGVTLVKYIPQVLLNYSRKSTVGWNITGCVMDLVGGLLSQLQLILDCNDTNDWGGITGDFVKLALGAVSVIFDVIFIVQHYILYPVDAEYHNLPPSDPLLSKHEHYDA